jgi:hypothetical protein
LAQRTAPKNTSSIRETDLYEPVRDFLLEQGYVVRSEVLNCDITATRENELVIIELKRTLNVKLLVQASERQKFSKSVYVAILEPQKKSRHYRGVLRLLKKLQLGLITVRFGRFGPRVNVVFDPPIQGATSGSKRQGKYRQALLTELSGRTDDYNVGGSNRTRLVTAYRERAIFIACCLDLLGPQSPKQLRELGTSDDTGQILGKNHYHWFRRISRGIYEISKRGSEELLDYPDIVNNSKLQLETLTRPLICDSVSGAAVCGTAAAK